MKNATRLVGKVYILWLEDYVILHLFSGERILSLKTLREAEDGRDALAKELFTSVFAGIIDRINHVLRPDQGRVRYGVYSIIKHTKNNQISYILSIVCFIRNY